MNTIESRKKLLVAESEINRAQLVQEWQAMSHEARALARQARIIRSLAAGAASLVVGLASFRRKKPATGMEKPSWLQKILNGAGLISNLWLAFRSAGREPKDQ